MEPPRRTSRRGAAGSDVSMAGAVDDVVMEPAVVLTRRSPNWGGRRAGAGSGSSRTNKSPRRRRIAQLAVARAVRSGQAKVKRSLKANAAKARGKRKAVGLTAPGRQRDRARQPQPLVSARDRAAAELLATIAARRAGAPHMERIEAAIATPCMPSCTSACGARRRSGRQAKRTACESLTESGQCGAGASGSPSRARPASSPTGVAMSTGFLKIRMTTQHLWRGCNNQVNGRWCSGRQHEQGQE
jgi:hypothetical protein